MRFSDWSSDVCSSDLLLDLQRVEVLKGPQGTLFGRNTIGGALNIVTSDPGNEWKVKAEATTGRYNRVDFRGSLDAPVIPDILRLGFDISTKHRDGYQQRKIGRAHVCTPVTNAHLVCRLLLVKTTNNTHTHTKHQ